MKTATAIIRINDQPDGSQAVSAREVYAFLQVRTDFSDWCKRMFEYGFEEGQDFTPILGKSTGGRPSQDYVLTLDCAKEIAMLQRTERGKQARSYFIEVERRYKAQQQDRGVLALPDFTDPASAARAWASEWEGRKVAEQKVTVLEERVQFFEQVTNRKGDLLDMAQVAKLLRFEGVGRTHLFELLRAAGWLQPNNEPYQQYVDKGWLGLVESYWHDGDGVRHLYMKPVATQKGLETIGRLLEKQGYQKQQTQWEEPSKTESEPPIAPPQLWVAPVATMPVQAMSRVEQFVVDIPQPPAEKQILVFHWRRSPRPESLKPGTAMQRFQDRLGKISLLSERTVITKSESFYRAMGYYAGLCQYYGRELECSFFSRIVEKGWNDLFEQVQSAVRAGRQEKAQLQ